jgi:hypothetical protein
MVEAVHRVPVSNRKTRRLGSDAFSMGTKIESQLNDVLALTLAPTRQPNYGSIRPKSPLLRR